MPARYQALLRYLLSCASPEDRADESLVDVLAEEETNAEPTPESWSVRWVCNRAASQVSPETDGRALTSGLAASPRSASTLCSATNSGKDAAAAPESKRNASMTS